LIFDFGDISKNAPNYIYAGGADDKKKRRDLEPFEVTRGNRRLPISKRDRRRRLLVDFECACGISSAQLCIGFPYASNK
jgi:hypothetical protein